jgi:sugar transferase (PEP-CTERM/EpsH1 system associated)
VIYRLTVGGLENGLTQLINRMPPERYRHAVVCLTEFTDFKNRIHRPDVPVIALNKRGGWDTAVYRKFWRVLRELSPAVVHTRNLGVLEIQIVAALAGVPCRIHGEHGRDMYDLHGTRSKYTLFRKAVRPLVHHYTAVSRDLAGWLASTIGAPADCITQIYNGVDSERFCPAGGNRRVTPEGFVPENGFVVGTVGRIHTVKDQPTLVRAFLHLLEARPAARDRVRLVVVGEGPLRAECQRMLEAAGASSLAWLPGERFDIPELMQSIDLFVLPSLGEGISNTILEAMACGLPVVATRVGGTPELIVENETGMLVPPADPETFSQAIGSYLDDPDRAKRHGRAGRARIEAGFNWSAMVRNYMAVYDAVLEQCLAKIGGAPAKTSPPHTSM